jgi:transposase
VVRKYADFLPLYRQSVILARDAGVTISRATLDGWVMQVGELLRPMVGAMRQDLLGGSYLQADETPVGVQMHDGRGQNHQAYLWQYGHPRGSVVFDFRLGRDRAGPKQFLADFAGVLQSDGYGAYDHVGGHGLVHAACSRACPAQVRRRGQTQSDRSDRDPAHSPNGCALCDRCPGP